MSDTTSPASGAGLLQTLDEAAARGGSVSAVFCWQIPFLSIPGAFDREELEQTYKNYVNEIVSAVARRRPCHWPPWWPRAIRPSR